jgi:hypothetical protein
LMNEASSAKDTEFTEVDMFCLGFLFADRDPAN